jgi:ABC-type nitrate/sulfonate/bicarbonate transport system permease component
MPTSREAPRRKDGGPASSNCPAAITGRSAHISIRAPVMTDQTTPASAPARPALAPSDLSTVALGFCRRPWVMRTLSILFVLGLWEWAGRIPVSPTFPTFTATMAALFGMMADGSLFRAYGETLKPMIVGVGLCGIFGVGLGLAMGLSRRFEWLTLPVWVISQAAPMAAIIPLITFVYGIGLGAKVVAVVIMAAPIVVLNAYTGIRNVNASHLEMGSAFMATRTQKIFNIILPAASGLIFAGFRLGLAQGLTGAVLAELLITPTGVGDLITYSRSIADYPAMFASVFSIIMFASVAVTLLQKLETRVFRPDQRATD